MAKDQLQMRRKLRWMPRFSMRCLLLFIFALSLPSAYLGLPVATYYREDRVLRDLETLGASYGRRVFHSDGGLGLQAAAWWGRGEEFFARVVRIDLSDKAVTDKDVLPLFELRALRSVNLANTNITDETARRLIDLPRINSVNLSGTRVTDASGKSLKILTHLHHVDLTETAVTDRVLDSLSELPNLRSLKTSQTAITMSAIGRQFSVDILHDSFEERFNELGYVGGGSRHIRFWLDSARKVQLLIDALQSMRHSSDHFVSLGFTDGIATNETIRDVAEVARIVALQIDSSRISDEAIAGLKTAHQLRYLAIHNAQISPACLRHLCSLDVEVLILPIAAVPDDLDSFRRQMPQLRSLVFSDSNALTRSEFCRVANRAYHGDHATRFRNSR